MKPFDFIHKMPTDQLYEYATHLRLDIMSRRRRHREFMSLRRYLGAARLELAIRQRKSEKADMADAYPANVEYAWQARKDCGVL